VRKKPFLETNLTSFRVKKMFTSGTFFCCWIPGEALENLSRASMVIISKMGIFVK
jgi:hypothetical protein